MVKYLITTNEAVSITAKTTLKGTDSHLLGTAIAYKIKQPGKRGRDENLYAFSFDELKKIANTACRVVKKNELGDVSGAPLPQLRLIKGYGEKFPAHFVYDEVTNKVYKFDEKGEYIVFSNLEKIEKYDGKIKGSFIRLSEVPRGIVQLKSDRETDVNYVLKRDQIAAAKLRKQTRTIKNISSMIKTNSLSEKDKKSLYQMVKECEHQEQERNNIQNPKVIKDKVSDYLLDLIESIQKIIEEDVLTTATFKEFKFGSKTLKVTVSIE